MTPPTTSPTQYAAVGILPFSAGNSDGILPFSAGNSEVHETFRLGKGRQNFVMLPAQHNHSNSNMTSSHLTETSGDFKVPFLLEEVLQFLF